jgi:hypothetical protein
MGNEKPLLVTIGNGLHKLTLMDVIANEVKVDPTRVAALLAMTTLKSRSL